MDGWVDGWWMDVVTYILTYSLYCELCRMDPNNWDFHVLGFLLYLLTDVAEAEPKKCWIMLGSLQVDNMVSLSSILYPVRSAFPTALHIKWDLGIIGQFSVLAGNRLIGHSLSLQFEESLLLTSLKCFTWDVSAKAKEVFFSLLGLFKEVAFEVWGLSQVFQENKSFS